MRRVVLSTHYHSGLVSRVVVCSHPRWVRCQKLPDTLLLVRVLLVPLHPDQEAFKRMACSAGQGHCKVKVPFSETAQNTFMLQLIAGKNVIGNHVIYGSDSF